MRKAGSLRVQSVVEAKAEAQPEAETKVDDDLPSQSWSDAHGNNARTQS